MALAETLNNQEVEETADLGPAMLQLSERQRLFVQALLAQPGKPNHTKAARQAGYVDEGNGAIRVRAHLLMSSPRIMAALHEEANVRFRILGWMGVRNLGKIAANAKHPDHYKASKDLADRFGFAAVTEHKVTVERTDKTGAAMAKRIEQLAAVLGVDPQKLLGTNVEAPAAGEIVEGEFVVINAEKP